jgi:type VI secretion system protein ImpL
VLVILVVLLIAAVLYLLYMRHSDGTVPAAPGGRLIAFPKPETGSPLDAALRRLGALGSQRERLHQLPMCMLVGEPGSGRTSLMAGVNLRMPYGPPSREELEAGGWGVWVFDQGLVLDMPGLSQTNEPTWRAILQRLRGLRAQRPIDGVMLAIPATDLTGPSALDATQLERKAQGLSKALQELRGALGVHFPIHVVITRGDVIPGFTGLCRTLPPRGRDEMLGWSSPYSPQEPYASGWVDEAFRDLHEALSLLQLELFADGRGEPADRDAAFLFPNELRSLAEPLRRMLDAIFRPTLSVEPLLLRGIYVSGDPEADGAVALGKGRTSSTRTPAFVTHLLERKVFPESGLASADARGERGHPKKLLSPLMVGAIAGCALLVLLALLGLAGAMTDGSDGQAATPAPAASQTVTVPAEPVRETLKSKTAQSVQPRKPKASRNPPRKPRPAQSVETGGVLSTQSDDAPAPEAEPAY